MLRLQRMAGNQAVMRMLGVSGGSDGGHSEDGGHGGDGVGHGEALAVNEPGDRFEREADSVAEQVMRTPESQVRPVAAHGGGLQRKCSSCEEEEEQRRVQRQISDAGTSVQRKCSSCEEEEEKKLQRKESGERGELSVLGPALHGEREGPGMQSSSRPTLRRKREGWGTPDHGERDGIAPDSVHDVLRAPGRPLDSSARSFMEPRFGRDFSGVRIHTGTEADRAARDVSAAAFTVGPDIAFASGRYAPETESGRHLLAHELTHTVQQGHAAGLRPESLKVGAADDPAEREAGAAADRAISPDTRTMGGFSSGAPAVRRGTGDPPKLRTTGLTQAEWAKIKATRKYFNLPDRPTSSQSTIVGVLVDDKTGKEYPLKSGEEGGPYGGTQRGNVPRGRGEGFTQGGQHQGNIASHVEGHAAAVMHENNITEATLLIEEMPCEGACDATRGWDPVKGDWAPGTKRPGTPNISTALPPGTKLTVVDPEAAGIYRSSQIPTTVPKPPGAPPAPPASKPPGAPPEDNPFKAPDPVKAAPLNTPDPAKASPLGTLEPAKPVSINTPPPAKPASINTPPPAKPTSINTPPPEFKPSIATAADPLAELEARSLTPKLPEAPLTKMAPKSALGLAAAEGEASIGARALAGLGNIAFDVAMLVAVVVWELVVVPKLNKLQAQLDQWRLDLENDKRTRMQEQIKQKFDVYEAAHIGRIVKSCWLGKLRELEKANKTAYVNVGLNVSFEDTSGRFQLFTETPPDSVFDLEFYDVDLVSVAVSDKPQKDSVGALARCESCGAMGRSRSFISNNPLWQQLLQFSFQAPKAAEIAKEYEKEPDLGACIADSACFIATACYGTSRAPELDVLRRFRDQVLAKTSAGRWFVRKYYQMSPPVALWLWRHEWARKMVREGLVGPLVRVLR